MRAEKTVKRRWTMAGKAMFRKDEGIMLLFPHSALCVDLVYALLTIDIMSNTPLPDGTYGTVTTLEKAV